MHTSYLTLCLFLGGVVIALSAQIINYLSTALEQRTCKRKLALGLGLAAVLVTATAAYMAAINWSALPTSSAGLRSGQLWNDGGVPAIVK